MPQNSWPTRLMQNTALALCEVGKLKPVAVENAREKRQHLTEQLDSILCSKRFIELEYEGDKKETFLLAITEKIDALSIAIHDLPDYKTIGELYKLQPEAVPDQIVLIFNDLRLFFQVGNMITDAGLYSLAALIIAEYAHLALEELVICCKEAKLGQYGNSFNRLDAATILSWLRQYNATKSERLKERNYVKEVHYKIGVSNGRSAGNIVTTEQLHQAHAAVAIEQVKNK